MCNPHDAHLNQILLLQRRSQRGLNLNERSVALSVSVVAQVNSLKSFRSKARSRRPHRLGRVLSDCNFVSKIHRRLHQSGSEGLCRKGQQHLKFLGHVLLLLFELDRFAFPLV